MSLSGRIERKATVVTDATQGIGAAVVARATAEGGRIAPDEASDMTGTVLSGTGGDPG